MPGWIDLREWSLKNVNSVSCSGGMGLSYREIMAMGTVITILERTFLPQWAGTNINSWLSAGKNSNTWLPFASDTIQFIKLRLKFNALVIWPTVYERKPSGSLWSLHADGTCMAHILGSVVRNHSRCKACGIATEWSPISARLWRFQKAGEHCI